MSVSFPQGSPSLWIDDLDSCRVVYANRTTGFLAHYCQGLRGSSGGPIFLLPDSSTKDFELVMIGIHIGRPGQIETPPKYPGGNEAILFPSWFLAEIEHRKLGSLVVPRF
jgi:hypothetical protein